MTSDSSSKPRRRRRLYVAAALSVMVLAVTGVALQAWLDWSGFVPPRDAQATAEASRAAEIRELDRRLAALERRLSAVAENKPEVVPVESYKLWWIAETERYLVEAVERLETGSGIQSALSALNSASRTMEATNLAGVEKVKKALDAEILSLTEYRNEDAEQALAIIDELLVQINGGDGLESNGGEGNGGAVADESVRPADLPATPGAWDRLTGALIGRLKHLVVVEKKGGVEKRRVMQGVIARSLILARTAVLGDDDVSYRHAIANAMQTMEHNNETGEPAYAKLQALYALDVAGTPPRIGLALDEIRALAAEMAR